MKSILSIIIIIILALIVFNIKKDKTVQAPIQNEIPAVSGPNKDDLDSFSVNPGGVVSGEMVVTGTVRGAYFFEGNISVDLLDASQNILKKGYGTAITDWMTAGPVTFTSNIDATGLSGPGYIKIQNDDPSDGEGGPAKIILIPVVFQ